MTKADFEERSIEWLEGYLSSCYDHAVWKDGTMYLGCGITRYADVKNIVLAVIKEKEKNGR
jgi:hypothetical protein